ncbi:MAG: hypothetical protein CMN90_08685 [Sutterellaceae bacterium]|nr:hypothetical protein [Sutterellaceae bacterium]
MCSHCIRRFSCLLGYCGVVQSGRGVFAKRSCVVWSLSRGSHQFKKHLLQPDCGALDGVAYNLTTGDNNTALGQVALFSTTSGYGRGLSFIGDYAIFGISKPRHDGYVPDFPLHDRLKALHMPDRCQLIAVNLKTGHVIQAITFEGAAREFFDTVVIPDCRNGVIMNLDEAQHPQLITCAQNDLAVSA